MQPRPRGAAELQATRFHLRPNRAPCGVAVSTVRPWSPSLPSAARLKGTERPPTPLGCPLCRVQVVRGLGDTVDDKPRRDDQAWARPFLPPLVAVPSSCSSTSRSRRWRGPGGIVELAGCHRSQDGRWLHAQA